MVRTTTTIQEAERILDIVSAALQEASHPHPVSALQGYDIFDICIALKLRIANEFLLLSRRPDFDARFSEGLRLYQSLPWQVMSSFVADDQLGQSGAKLVISAVDQATMQLDKDFASIETASSFGDFCKSLGTTEPNYWQRVYERIGIEHTSDSPQGNRPVTPSEHLSINQCQEIVYAFIDCMAENPPLIGDSRLLPFPKSVILYAIGNMLNHYECQQETIAEPDLRKPYDDIISRMQYLSNALISQWHDIDSEDKEGVAALNRLSSFPEWALPLKQKYLNDEKAANEALDATLRRMKRRVDAERR